MQTTRKLLAGNLLSCRFASRAQAAHCCTTMFIRAISFASLKILASCSLFFMKSWVFGWNLWLVLLVSHSRTRSFSFEDVTHLWLYTVVLTGRWGTVQVPQTYCCSNLYARETSPDKHLPVPKNQHQNRNLKRESYHPAQFLGRRFLHFAWTAYTHHTYTQ